MKTPETTSLLNTAYESLGYSEAEGISFFNAQNKPGKLAQNIWLDKGDWLSLAHEVRADKIFFVENNPVAVFARLDTDDDEVLHKFYNGVWSMARPRFLFLAKPGELAVYDLATKPPKSAHEFRKLKPLEIAETTAAVAEKLKWFRREELESGRVFEEYRFGDLKYRADQALIHDLKEVRRELIAAGLGGEKLKYAHALIGRSIFIRYLEDREILTKKTFDEVARQEKRWQSLLKTPPARAGLDFTETPSLYLRVLTDKKFCYALFRKLTDDFNGDMFPDVDVEEKIITLDHLRLIQDLLFGDAGQQKSLFFYAYQFKIIPIELISSIYEEFYQEENGGGHEYGAFYTPPALVDFVLAQTLTPERLATSPRIMDPACGSGIFLVESFRRIVRYRVARQGRRLRFDELQKILREQLRGIDINPEAIRVAAFSLYLSLLHYLEPPDIHEQIERGNRLPNLVVDDEKPDSFNVLLAANAFDLELIESRLHLKEHFSSNSADIVVSNPPWGQPKGKEAVQAAKVAKKWCGPHRPTGDSESSQAFVWRSIDILNEDGCCGLILPVGVLLKHHKNSFLFRSGAFKKLALRKIFNFSHTRDIFFSKTVSPFIVLQAEKNNQTRALRYIEYWSARKTAIIDSLQSVVLCKADLKVASYENEISNHRVWKALNWGNHRDLALIEYLINHFKAMKDFTSPELYGRGYEAGNEDPANWLVEYKSLPSDYIKCYGESDLSKLQQSPQKVRRAGRGKESIFQGLRILVKRGIAQRDDRKGRIIARLEDQKFSYPNSVYGIKFSKSDEDFYKTVLGVLWSSVGKYFLLLTSYDFGVWHDEIRLKGELLDLPIFFSSDSSLRDKVIKLVDELRNYDPPTQTLINPDGVPEHEIQAKRRELETQLDEAVFELYGLGEAEIDLIRDMCDTNLDFYYLKEKSEAAKPVFPNMPKKSCGTKNDLAVAEMGDYLRLFMQSWLPYLNEGTEFHWRVHQFPQSDSMLAAVFSIQNIGDIPIPDTRNESAAWKSILRRLDDALLQPVSSRIYIDGLIRSVSNEEIIIIKRNEKRLWTKSMAREDAEATLVQAMNRDRMGKGV